MDSPGILIVEDDVRLARHLSVGLAEAGFEVRVAATLQGAEEAFAEAVPGLVLLDLGLPDAEGIDVLRRLRALAPRVPVIITTARDGISDRVEGLDAGADDYLVKPYAFEELLARVRTQLRHMERSTLVRKLGPIALDLEKHVATCHGDPMELTPREFDLLAYLMSLEGGVATREMLQRDVWKVRSRMTSMDNVIDVHISRLRQKMNDGDCGPALKTVRGVGFALRDTE